MSSRRTKRERMETHQPAERMATPRPPRDESLPVDRILRLIGLGLRARGAVVGVERVRESARTGKLAFAVVASDASKNSLDKLLPLLRARRISFIEVPSSAALGAVAGRDQTVAIGVLDRQLAR